MMHLWPKWYPKAALAMLAIVACTSATPASPTPVPTPTPTATSIPTPTPTRTSSTPYWPSYLDFAMAADLNLKTPGYSGLVYWSIQGDYPAFAAIYVASECFAGNPLTPEGFRTFLDQELLHGAVPLAREVTGKLLALQGKDVRGSCIEPFMYPKTGTEAYLGQALINAPHGGLFASALDSSVRRAAAQWFQQEPQKREAFVPWLWNMSEMVFGRGPLLQIPSSVSVPQGDTQLPITWAMDYQLSVMQMINERQQGTIDDLVARK